MIATAAPLTSLEMPSPADGVRAERAMVIAAQRGSDEAFSDLVRIHQRRAYGIVRAIVLSHEDAEDAVQEGFLHAHRALDRFRPDQPFGAWLYRIMANAALDLVRRRKVRAAEELPEAIPMPFRDPAESADLRERVKEARTNLTDRQPAVIVMHALQLFTPPDTC